MLLPSLLLVLSAQATVSLPDVFENEAFVVRQITLGSETVGPQPFSAVVTNRSGRTRTLIVDIRVEATGPGTANWQGQFNFPLAPGEMRRITADYEIPVPLLRRTILRFGEATDPAAFEGWLWTKTLDPSSRPSAETLRATFAPHELHLSRLSDVRLSELRRRLPEAIQRSRTEGALRGRLRDLFRPASSAGPDFGYRIEPWEEDTEKVESTFSAHAVAVESFSITGEGGTRITAFIATAKDGAEETKPLLILLSGNPPGTRERMASGAAFFARLGYHAVGVARRKTARVWDSKARFLSYSTDPVNDVRRLIDYLQSQSRHRFSRIGLYGFSAGAREGMFVAALDDRISAAALASGLTSHDWSFKDDAWIPTFSGMIVFPDLGLGTPDIGNLRGEQRWETIARAKPEHHARARAIFAKEFPYFEDMDPVKVAPLAAPIPLLIVSGARDGQFQVPGVVEVDEAVQQSYAKLGFSGCADLYIGPRAGHAVDVDGSRVICAFFDRWLR